MIRVMIEISDLAAGRFMIDDLDQVEEIICRLLTQKSPDARLKACRHDEESILWDTVDTIRVIRQQLAAALDGPLPKGED